MAKLTKRAKLIQEKVEIGKIYTVDDAVNLLNELSTVKFKESIDVAINLGIDSRKSDQTVRGASVLPNGTGKTVRVAVFAQGAKAEEATAAGADIVGFEDLAATIKGGEIDFDVLIATPDAMRLIGALGPVLGPRGLMPNPKVGTVTPDVTTAVTNAKGGQVRFRADKGGIVHCIVGQVGFDAAAIKGNIEALMVDLKKSKPASSKGTYLQKLTLSTTMGPGLTVDMSTLEV